jgi:UrcA family protein
LGASVAKSAAFYVATQKDRRRIGRDRQEIGSKSFRKTDPGAQLRVWRVAVIRRTRPELPATKENKTMLKIVGTTLAAAALLASAAHAASPMIRTDVPVVYSDLDLSTEGGARALFGRIELAAAKACGSAPLFYSSYNIAPGLAAKEFNTCRANAINTAMKSLNFPMVQKIYATADAPYLQLASGK